MHEIPSSKVCTNCGKRKRESLFYRRKIRGKGSYLHHLCIECHKNKTTEFRRLNQVQFAIYSNFLYLFDPDHQKRKRIKNRESLNLNNKKWRLANSVKVKRNARKYYKENRLRILGHHKKYATKLTDCYVASKIKRVGISYVPPDAIKIKRAHIKLGRIIKQVSKTKTK